MSLSCPLCDKPYSDVEEYLLHLFRDELMTKEQIIKRFVPSGVVTINEIENYVNKH